MLVIVCGGDVVVGDHVWSCVILSDGDGDGGWCWWWMIIMVIIMVIMYGVRDHGVDDVQWWRHQWWWLLILDGDHVWWWWWCMMCDHGDPVWWRTLMTSSSVDHVCCMVYGDHVWCMMYDVWWWSCVWSWMSLMTMIMLLIPINTLFFSHITSWLTPLLFHSWSWSWPTCDGQLPPPPPRQHAPLWLPTLTPHAMWRCWKDDEGGWGCRQDEIIGGDDAGGGGRRRSGGRRRGEGGGCVAVGYVRKDMGSMCIVCV